MAGQYNNISLRNTSIYLKEYRMLKIKPGVKVTGMQVPMIIATIVAESFCNKLDVDCVITSCIDGTHSVKSKHYTGNALDFRTRDMNGTQQQMFFDAVSSGLGTDYDVILEHNHLHVEYEPRNL